MKDTLKRFVGTVRRVAIPTGGLAQRTVTSGLWMTAMNVGDRGLQTILLIILASLLVPADFGLLGIALLTLSALAQFTFLGIDDALIQRREENVDVYLNTAWIIQLVRGLVIAAIVYLSAPYIAAFFGEPRATDVLRVIAISPILLGIRNPGIVYFRKNLEFHKQFVLTISGSVANFVVAIALALDGYGVWALVWGYVVSDAVRLVASYAVHDYRPGLGFDVPKAKAMLGYGKWLTGATILHFLLGEGDDIVVGWVLTATSLGLYQVAYRIARAPATEVTHVITRVMFPAFAKLQDDLPALRDAFYRTVQLSAFIGFPIGMGIITVAPTFVEAFLGEEWLPMVLTMQLIGVYGLILSVTSTFGSVWKAVGRPDYLTKIGIVRLVGLAIVIVPMTQAYGIEGTAAAVLAVYLVPTLPLDIHFVIKAIDGSYARLGREVVYPLAASLAMGGAVVLADSQLSLWSPVAEFALLVGTGVAVYAISVAVLERGFGWGMQRNFRAILMAMRG